MRSRWLRYVAISVCSIFAGCAALRAFLPERYAVDAVLLNNLLGWGSDEPARGLAAPPEYAVSVYAALPRVRMLLATPRGDLVASVPRDGRVVLLARDKDDDGLPDAVRDLLSGLDRPHGLALSPDGWLYVGEGSAIGRVRFDVATGDVEGPLERIVTGLPEGGNHWPRNVGVGPDGRLFVTVGSSCNACFEADERRAAMLRFEADGSGGSIYARGLRNAIDFAWRPGTGELFATDNGRDLLGDDFPPCELNRIVEGGDYGWPVANGDRVPDPDLGAGQEARIAASIPPVFGFRAHNAPLGIAFLAHPTQPERFVGAALVALHGSWNRTTRDGYRVVSLHWDAKGAIEERDFLTGFLVDGKVLGRPVDVVEAPNSGTIYVSDDYAGAIYAIRRAGVAPTPAPPVLPPPAAPAPALDPLGALLPDERAALAARGAERYAALGCAGCHEPLHATPGVIPKVLGGLAARYDLEALTGFLATPTPPMPPVTGDAADRRALAVHVLERFGH
jgi:glucose/arabinose dehydrogenase